MLHWNNIRTATEYFTHLHNIVFMCAINIFLGQCITASNKVYQINAVFSLGKEKVTHKVTAKGSSVMAISSRHCLWEASTQSLLSISAVSHFSYQTVVEPLMHWYQAGVGLTHSLCPPSTPTSLPESLRNGHQRPLPIVRERGGEAEKIVCVCVGY